ncbi:MAG: tRNA(Ile)(2)-agmatinylcytidine synthase [Candidatus Bathyarchaeia archaeon]
MGLRDSLLHIGIDDTDSPRMGCTTYIGALLVEYLKGIGCSFTDSLNLIRLNPNIPWKTRGNGAVALRVKLPHNIDEKEIKDDIIKIVEDNSDLDNPGTDPAICFLKGSVPGDLSALAKKAVQDICQLQEAGKIREKYRIEFYTIKGLRGIIGALAAIGETLDGDYTYELIAYRTHENRGTPRRIDEASVIKMDKATYPYTFNNYDYEKRRVLIAPHGPDPILFGVRGETPEILIEAYKTIKLYEPVERWVIFRSNQGTDAHLSRVNYLGEAKPYTPIQTRGIVSANPFKIKGGHVLFKLTDNNRSGEVDCAAYEPTGSFRIVVESLEPGDEVEVSGGIRPPSKGYGKTINLEKLQILRLNEKIIQENPYCYRCNRRMESSGRGQGYRCRRCGTRSSSKMNIKAERYIKPGLYMPPPRAHRHLTKPFLRYGREKDSLPKNMIEIWHYP